MNKIGNWIGVLLLVSFLLTNEAAASPVYALGTIRYVTPTGLNSGSCSSWAKACNLQRALAVVAVSGNQLWVKQGTYKPGSGRNDTFHLRNGIKIYGGFAGTETQLTQRNPVTHVTTLSGDLRFINYSGDNSYHVVTAVSVNATAVLDGFTITAGNANGSSPDDSGGGMLVNVSSATLTNLTFIGNSAFTNGGGIYIINSPVTLTNVMFSHNSAYYGGGMDDGNSWPALTNVTFQDNSATEGGGMINADAGPTLTNVTFTGNLATTGAGMLNFASSTPVLKGVTFDDNSASDSGGGMFNDSGSSPTLTNAIFNGNSATNDGGGIYSKNGSGAVLNGVTFYSNSADDGGGMYNDNSSPKLTNVTFDFNSATSAGGGILDYNGSNPTLTNTTFHLNSASGGGAMFNHTSSPTIYDSIIWKDGSEIVNNTSTPTIADSLITGGCPTGANCINPPINADPLLGPLANNGGFTQTMALGAGSPAIDAGGANSTCATTDQRGVTRPQGLHCDMGAYEVKALSFTSVAANDGWVLESSQGSNTGGSLNTSAGTFNVGDDSSNRRYRGFLSFNTASLPDAASVVLAQVRVRRQSVVGSPISTQGTLLADLVKPYFGSSLTLVNSDWQAAATVSSAGSFLQAGKSYWTSLNNAARSHINKTGTTQFRLYFGSDAYNGVADHFSLYSGDYNTTPSYRPSLIVYYNP